MARPGLQMLPSLDGWSVYYQSVLVARLHHQLLSETYHYLVYRTDHQWHRYLVEFMDNCRLGRQQLVSMIVSALISRGVEIEQYQFYPDCYYEAEPDGVYLRNRHATLYRSRKPVSEFSFEPIAITGKGVGRGMDKLTLSLRHDYRNYLLMTGSIEPLHRHHGFSGRGFSIQNHSMYIYSLHMLQRPIVKLYDTTPRNSHLHGIVFVKFMRQRYAYGVVYFDCPPNVVVNRIRRSIETAFGLSFPKRHLQISLVLVQGAVTAEGDVQMTDNYGNIIAIAKDGYYMRRSQLRDALDFPITALSTHYSYYPNIRRIIAWHLDRLVTIERYESIGMTDDEALAMDEDTQWETCHG